MKATVNAKEWEIALDNEAVKAIRFCYGVNTDLRVSLSGLPKDPLWYWIDENFARLFGFVISKPNPTSEDWNKYEKMINGVVQQIIR